MKKIVSFLVAVLSMFIFVGCFSSETDGTSGGLSSKDEGTSSKKVELVGSPTWEVEYSEYFGYSVEIKGVVKNGKSKDYSYVSIEFSIYDSEGNNLGTAMDSMNNLASGETWKFTASSLGWFEDEPVSFKLADITYW